MHASVHARAGASTRPSRLLEGSHNTLSVSLALGSRLPICSTLRFYVYFAGPAGGLSIPLAQLSLSHKLPCPPAVRRVGPKRLPAWRTASSLLPFSPADNRAMIRAAGLAEDAPNPWRMRLCPANPAGSAVSAKGLGRSLSRATCPPATGLGLTSIVVVACPVPTTSCTAPGREKRRCLRARRALRVRCFGTKPLKLGSPHPGEERAWRLSNGTPSRCGHAYCCSLSRGGPRIPSTPSDAADLTGARAANLFPPAGRCTFRWDPLHPPRPPGRAAGAEGVGRATEGACLSFSAHGRRPSSHGHLG